MTAEIIKKATALVAEKPDLSEVLASLKDKSIPVEDRWEAYTILVNGALITKMQSYGNGFTDVLRKPNCDKPGRHYSPYDDFGFERHETREFSFVLELIQDRLEDEDFENVPTAESIIAWKESVLASGCAGFTYDW